MIKKFENFLNEEFIVPFMPELTINSIIEALNEQRPIIHYRQGDIEKEFDEAGGNPPLSRKLGFGNVGTYSIYWTKIKIDGQEIPIECKKNIYIPLPIAIATIANYAIGYNKESIKLYRTLAKLYKEQLNEAYYPDLTPYVYDSNKGLKNPVNIGWLDKGQDYTKGEVPKGFLRKLSNASTCGRHKGSHRCPFCGDDDSSNVRYVVGKGITYIFPDMLDHYISEHGYKPPQEFIDAVMTLPEKKKERYKSSGFHHGFSDNSPWGW